MSAEEIDRAEIELAKAFLQRRAERPEEDLFLAYAAIYGCEVVFEDAGEPNPGDLK